MAAAAVLGDPVHQVDDRLPAEGEVHVWSLALDRWPTPQAGLRALLGQYLDADPAALQFANAPGGKPRLDPPSKLRFNLSHSGDLCLVACARVREVGIDVEQTRPVDVERLVRRALLKSERAAVEEAADPQREFLRHWVAKEAVAKAMGGGLQSLRSFEVSLTAPDAPRVIHVGGDRQAARRWTLTLLDVTGYVAALAIEGNARITPIARFDP